MLEFYHNLIGIIGDYLIRGMFISVLTVWIAGRIFKKLDTQNAKVILKWIMIGYACLAIINVLTIIFDEFYNGVEFDSYSFGFWAFGDYWLSYWLMLTGNMILPFILLSKRISSKFIFMFLVAVMMNIDWFFEWFVVVVTSFHRDYLMEDGNFRFSQLFPYGNWIYLLSGLVLGVVVLGVENVIRRFQKLK